MIATGEDRLYNYNGLNPRTSALEVEHNRALPVTSMGYELGRALFKGYGLFSNSLMLRALVSPYHCHILTHTMVCCVHLELMSRYGTYWTQSGMKSWP